MPDRRRRPGGQSAEPDAACARGTRAVALVDPEFLDLSRALRLLEQLPVGVFLNRPDGHCFYVNSRCAEIVGVPAAQCLGHGWSSTLAAADRTPARLAWENAVATGTAYEAPQRFEHPGGRRVQALVRIAPERSEDRGVVGWIGMIQDVTAAAELEARLRLAGAVFENALEGIMVTDTSGSIVAVNPAFEEITGYRAAEAVGKRPRIGHNDRVIFEQIQQGLATAGRWQGEVWNRRRNGELYPQWLHIGGAKDAAGEPSHYVAVFSDITELRSSELRLERLAHYDPLTGLANRALLFSRIEHALAHARRSSSRVAVLFLDLDRFKNINYSLGHPVGDELLVGIARRLQHRIRTGDTFARLGGDEFVVVMENLREATEAATLGGNIIDLLAQPFVMADGSVLYVSCSIGISVFPENGADAASLIRNADAAMYHAKEAGRGTFRYYTASLTDAANERLELDTRLRRALEREEFRLHFQAKLDRAGRIIGAEALVRWQPPEGPLVPPNRFITAAEETGLIVPLGEWVLRRACERARAWLDAGLPQLTIAVNLSNVQFRSRGLVDRVRLILGETRLPPELLELEITESAIMEPVHDALAHLDALRQLGVRLALDDFGTGYSSLAALKRLPLHVLKIDQSFVRGLPDDRSDAQIVRTIITMAQNLGLWSLAEGVETPAQLAMLRTLGCQYFQGYHFARPEPAEEFEARVRGAG